MNNKRKAEQYYRYFSGLEGNQHIANLFAIQKLLDLIDTYKPKKILEVGLGIGSISYAIIDFLENKNRDFDYLGTESNEFCLNALETNLKGHYSKLNIYESINTIDKEKRFDLIIIDGSDDALEVVANLISKNGIIFIEGDRKQQQNILIQLFPNHKFVHSISNYREPEFGPFITGHWSGGGKIIYVNPTLKQNINWFFQKISSVYRNRFIRVVRKTRK